MGMRDLGLGNIIQVLGRALHGSFDNMGKHISRYGENLPQRKLWQHFAQWLAETHTSMILNLRATP